MNHSIRIKRHDEQFFTAQLIYFAPDWDRRLKFRGYALTLINSGFRHASFLLANPYTFVCGVVNVNEVFLHPEDNRRLKRRSRQHHDRSPIVFEPFVYEAWLLNNEIARLEWHLSRSGDVQALSRHRRILHKTRGRLWRRVLQAVGETAVCHWTHQGSAYGEFAEYWRTGCGATWQFTVDGPAENGMNFCHSCGQPLVAVGAAAVAEGAAS